jgi:hypothetical protein
MTIFHRVEVPEQGDSIAPTQPKEMRSPFAALKKAPRLQAVNDCLPSLGITRRENQERLATQLVILTTGSHQLEEQVARPGDPETQVL